MNDYFLADDLSGALDAAAAFHRVGRSVRIALSSAAAAKASPADVIGLTTETRNASPEAAGRVVREVVRAARARGARLCYKKIDSTLRGPVAAEIAALHEVLPGCRILFAPANPRVGRTVRDGLLRVNGVPVAETEFGRDPGSPLRTSRIGEILGSVIAANVHIPDTETEADLARAVEAMERGGADWVPVGSGALAIPVAARMAAPPAHRPVRSPLGASPVLMIGGSAHPLNRRQIDRLLALRPGQRILVDPDRPERAAEIASGAVANDALAVLQLPEIRIAPQVALRAAVAAATPAIRSGGVRRVFVTGGETAYALCAELGIAVLQFEAELEPGLSLSRGETGSGPLLLAVKPGGFGDDGTWARALAALESA